MKSKHFLSFLVLAAFWLGLAHDSARAGGGNDTAYGSSALASDTSGNYNCAFGEYALRTDLIGSNNTATGYAALYSNTTGGFNSAFGTYALFANTTGSNNTAIGWAALAYSTGADNTANGFEALYNNTTGSNNIALGFQAGSLLTTGSNNIDIGHQGVAAESNIIRIGDGATQTDTYLTGIVHGNGSGLTGVTAGAPAYAYFYLLAPGDDAATIAAGTAISFPQTGPVSGISRTSATTFNLPAIGVYEVTWQVSVTEPGQLVLGLDSGAGPVELASTVVGRATGTSQIMGNVLIQTTVVNSVLSVLCPSGNSPALTITPFAGGTHAVSGSLVIKQIQ